jgi:hypothetical protein
VLRDNLIQGDFDLIVQPKSVDEPDRHCSGALGSRSSDGKGVGATSRNDRARLVQGEADAAELAAEPAVQIKEAKMQPGWRSHPDLFSPTGEPSMRDWFRATVHVARGPVLLLSSAKA